MLVARRTDSPVLRVGIPALAGLSVLHGFVPPHPGPLVAIADLNADLGLTLLFGLIVAIPTVIIAGPVFGTFIARRVPVAAIDAAAAASRPAVGRRGPAHAGSAGRRARRGDDRRDDWPEPAADATRRPAPRAAAAAAGVRLRPSSPSCCRWC